MKKIFLSLFIIGSLFILLLFLLKGQNEITNEDNSVQKLNSLPYAAWHPMEAKNDLKSGVTIYDEESAFKGVNIYNSRNKAEAHLMDMKGNILHTWSGSKSDVVSKWLHIEMNDKGDLFGVEKDVSLIKLDWNSKILWINKSSFHHDIDIAENGDIYSFTNDPIKILYKSKSVTILDDSITILDANGRTKKKISLYHSLGERLSGTIETEKKIDEQLDKRPDETIDVFHVNSIEIIKKKIDNFANKGDILISIREWNLIAVMDPRKEEIVWSWGENFLKAQHHPTLLDNGNILIFDNRGNEGYSRIIEMNPISKEVEWIYQPLTRNNFFSDTLGGNQKLPNGNLLITESNTGRVFELKEENDLYIPPFWAKDYFLKFKMMIRKGQSSLFVGKKQKIVWEFWNPEIMKKEKMRAAIYRMMRIDPKVLRKLPFDDNTLDYLKKNMYIH